MTKKSLILKSVLYSAVVGLCLWGLTFLSTNLLVLALSGLQMSILFYLRERLKKLEVNQNELFKLQDRATKTLTENQGELQKEIRRLRD